MLLPMIQEDHMIDKIALGVDLSWAQRRLNEALYGLIASNTHGQAFLCRWGTAYIPKTFHHSPLFLPERAIRNTMELPHRGHVGDFIPTHLLKERRLLVDVH